MKITINIDKAREVTKQRLRRERAPLLAQLDVDHLRALEEGSSVVAIAAAKKKLRDITKAADKAATLEGLRELRCTVDVVAG